MEKADDNAGSSSDRCTGDESEEKKHDEKTENTDSDEGKLQDTHLEKGQTKENDKAGSQSDSDSGSETKAKTPSHGEEHVASIAPDTDDILSDDEITLESAPNTSMMPSTLTLAILIISLGIGLGLLHGSKHSSLGLLHGSKPSHNYKEFEVFKRRIADMERDFPYQNELYWNLIRNGGYEHLTKVHGEDKRELTPRSYLVAGYAGSRRTVDCFVSRLASSFTDSNEHQYINSVEFSGDGDRERLYDEIMSKINGTNKFVIVNDIDKLKFKVAQLFMSFADSYNKVATYPQSLFIFTTELPFSYNPGRNRNKEEGKVGEHFKSHVWSGVHIDHAAPLWSRVGDGLMLIREEEVLRSCK